MCEPAHSIVQYPVHDNDDDSPFGGQMDMEQKLKAGLGEKIVQWGKRIKKWFHFSKLGSGHSESIQLSSRSSLILPEHTRYEGVWWKRQFIIDGSYHGARVDLEEAKQAAESYYQTVVGNNAQTFRRFLETSIQQSNREFMYFDRFVHNVLTKEGRDKILSDLKRLFGIRGPGIFSLALSVDTLFGKEETKVQVTKLLMGYTRKRNLYLPEWADDDSFWKK